MEDTNRHSKHDDQAAADWLEELADAAVPAVGDFEPRPYLPALDRERPQRTPLVPRTAYLVVAAAIAVIATVTGVAVWLGAQAAVAAPSVVGLVEGDARIELSRAGLQLIVAERRFSSAPEGQVIEQDPQPGTEVRRGDDIRVVLSAGTEEFVLPDVIGQGLSLATGTLEAKGLFVDVDFVLSDAASDTVLSSTPAPGATVRTGDRVRLQVSSPRDSGLQLRPYRLDGVVLVIDPAPPVPGISNDPTLEVARRLRSLLEASGATVRLLRTGADTSTVDADRAARAKETSYAAGIGITVASGAQPGMVVSTVTSLTASGATSPSILAAAVESALSSSSAPPRRQDMALDNVFGASDTLWVRVTLGSASSRDDVAAFIDPRWADGIARSLYQAVGQVLGSPDIL